MLAGWPVKCIVEYFAPVNRSWPPFSKWLCTHCCVHLMRLEKWLWKQWQCHLFNLRSRVCFHSKWTLSDTLTLPLILLSLCVRCVHDACPPCASYISSCLHAVYVLVCAFLRKRAWHEACWSWRVHAESLSSGENGFNRGRSRRARRNAQRQISANLHINSFSEEFYRVNVE